MFSQAWNIYFPVIKILIKRASAGEQSLAMNKTDFERAAGGRKAKLTFNFTLQNSRNSDFNTVIPPVAREFIFLLQEDPTTKQLLENNEFNFSMTSSFQLKIKKTLPEGSGEEAAEPEA
ncbi:MAG: hypothetical protein NTW29_05275 [Bacteroidetes bacterium]|nr:hypothetical protein [Bacteroidota bacterium]